MGETKQNKNFISIDVNLRDLVCFGNIFVILTIMFGSHWS